MKHLLFILTMFATVSIQAQRYDIVRLRPAPTAPGQTITSKQVGNKFQWTTEPTGNYTEYSAFITPINDTTLTVDVMKNTTGIDLTWSYVDTTIITTQANIDAAGVWSVGFTSAPSLISYDPAATGGARSVISYYTMSDEIRLRSYIAAGPRKYEYGGTFFVHYKVFRP